MNKYKALDLDLIMDKIAEYASLQEASSYLKNSEIIFNPLLIQRNINETKEAMAILNQGHDISFYGISDIRDSLYRCNINETISGQEIQSILSFHNHCQRLINIFKNIDLQYLNQYSDSLNLDNKLASYLDSIIDSSGNVKKSASKKLESLSRSRTNISSKLSETSKKFREENKDSLQENNVYYRDERLTFLIKNSDKNKYKGYQYGSSSSKQAVYVEPEEFVKLNNEKARIEDEYSQEIERILKEASNRIGLSSSIYLLNYESIISLDLIFAKANYGIHINGVMADFEKEGPFILLKARHPLLKESEAVYNNYSFPKEKKGIVISGSNTGGKTVSLKLFGLAIILTYMGIPLPCDKANVPFYTNVFVDMEDGQSITDSLSTFSSHLKNLDEIITSADQSSLVLIDELATGTDPKEAEALSLAILDNFRNNNIHFILTTHYEEIKKYAYEKDDILLSSVGFDNVNLKPTYKYYEGIAGDSNALTIASRYISNNEIIESAKEYLQKGRSEAEELLIELKKEKEDLETLKEILLNKENELNLLQEENIKLKNDLSLQKQKFKEESSKQLQDLLEEKSNQAQEIIDNLNSLDAKGRKEAIVKIEELNEEVIEDKNEIKIGDTVKIKGSERIGKVIKIEKDRYLIDIKGMSFNVKRNDLIYLGESKKEKKKYNNKNKYDKSFTSVKSEINLIGKRVEEALELLDKYLDDAYAAKRSSVKIIHGIGTLKLRTAIRSYLKNNKIVSSYKDGEYFDGGSAVTIVEFKRGSQK